MKALWYGLIGATGLLACLLFSPAYSEEPPAKTETTAKEVPERVRDFILEPDAEFDELLTTVEFESALENADVPAMAAWAKKMVEAEKKLGRPRKELKSKQMIASLGLLARRAKDLKSLESLSESARLLGDKDGTQTLNDLAAAIKKAPATTKPILLDLEGTSTEAYTTAKAALTMIERARLFSPPEELDKVAGYIEIAKSSEMLSAALAESLLARVQAAKAEIAEEAQDPITAKLNKSSRGVFDKAFKDFVGVFTPARPPTPPTFKGPPQQPPGPKYEDRATYPFGSHRIRLIAAKISGYNFTQPGMDTAAKDLLKNYKDSKTHIRDDKWYRTTLPEQISEYWMMVIHNTTTGKFEWGAIRNTPAAWLVRYSNRKEAMTLKDGNQAKERFTLNGTKTDLDIFNPEQKRGYPGNEIWYSFGY